MALQRAAGLRNVWFRPFTKGPLRAGFLFAVQALAPRPTPRMSSECH
jgi:hypothetical protein